MGKGHPKQRKVNEQGFGGRKGSVLRNEELSGPMAEAVPVSPGPHGSRHDPLVPILKQTIIRSLSWR